MGRNKQNYKKVKICQEETNLINCDIINKGGERYGNE